MEKNKSATACDLDVYQYQVVLSILHLFTPMKLNPSRNIKIKVYDSLRGYLTSYYPRRREFVNKVWPSSLRTSIAPYISPRFHEATCQHLQLVK